MRDNKTVIYTLGFILVCLACLMFVPAIFEKLLNGDDGAAFIISASITGFVGGGLMFAQNKSNLTLDNKQTYLLTTVAWLSITAFSALPFVFSNVHMSYTDAFFEAMSGLTTTGATTMLDLDSTSHGILFWRAFLQWIGGVGIIVLAVAILPFLRVGGMQLFRTESSDQSGKVLPRPGQIAVITIRIYAGLTVLCALLYFIFGMGFFDAIIHAMTTLSTGGFSTHDISFAYFEKNTPLIWISIIFMLAGSLPMLLYLNFTSGDFKKFFTNPQVLGFLMFATGAVSLVILWRWLEGSGGHSVSHMITISAFNVISVLTTTGYAIGDYSKWGHFPLVIFLFIGLVGGCTGSTAGGIKIFRLQVLFINTKLQIRRMLFPHSVQTIHYGGRILSTDIISSVVAFIFVYLLALCILTLVLSLSGLDFLTSISSVIASIASVGPGLGPVTGPCCTYAPLPDISKWVLSFAMMIGRLEVMTVLVLFSRSYWRH